MRTWLVIDVSYLCHRAFHTTQGLSWKEKPTGVVFGFLKSIGFFKDEFQTDHIAFCFEHPHLFRKEIFEGYKAKRHAANRDEAEIKSIRGLQIQISELRQRYLPMIGFKNIFCCRGMESDDLIASIAKNLPKNEEAILITADHDLYQCLRPNVAIYSPQARKRITKANFMRTYGIRPSQWAVMKAIAGCHGDEVPGVGGVGEKTALKYLRGELDPKCKAFQIITSKAGKERVRLNRRLVQLPYEGCPSPQLIEDSIDPKGWREVCGTLGMRSIAGVVPVATHRRGMLL